MDRKNDAVLKLLMCVCIAAVIMCCFSVAAYAEEIQSDVKKDIQVEETKQIDISEYDAGLSKNIFNYTGAEVKPSVVLKGLKKGTDYTVTYENNIDPGTAYVVISGAGKYCGEIALGFTIKPYAPENFKATLIGHDDVKLTWTEVPGAEGYYVYYKKSASSKYIFLDKVTECTFKIKDLSDHVNYDFKVISYLTSDLDGTEYKSPKACTTKIMTKKYIKSPASVKTVLYGYDDVKITWSKVEGATGYSVYYKKASQKTYAYLGKTSNRYFKKADLTDGVEYVFRVKPRYKVNDKYYVGYYGRNSSIDTLIKPDVKIDRCGFTTVKVKWEDINGVVGYQLSKSTKRNKNNIIYTIKSAIAASKETTAPLGKKYFYRVRVYTISDGKKIYSPWSDRIAYKTDDQYYPKIIRLAKNGKAMDIKDVAGQKLYGYDTVQGSCTDGKNGYYALYNRNVEKCKIAKIRLSDNKLIGVSKVLDIHHGNDLTYNNRTKKVMAVHMTEKSMAIGVINAGTLKLEKNVTIKIPEGLPGVSSFKIKKITGFNAIAYDSKNNRYVLRIRNLGDYLITDGNLNPIEYVTPKKKKHRQAVYAGLDVIDGYIASTQYRYNSGGYNIVQLHNWSGKYIGTVNINKKYELESSFNANGKVYAVYYYPFTANGKYNRSNYVCRFDF